MPVTLTQIAKQANVSLSLVSRFVNGDPTLRITDEKRRSIIDAHDRLGATQLNRHARPDRTAGKRTSNIVMPINRQFSERWVQHHVTRSVLYSSLEDRLRERGFRLSVTFFDPAKQFEFFDGLIRDREFCDGLCIPTGVADRPLADLLRNRSMPHVCLDPNAEHLPANTVYGSYSSEVHMALDHLSDLGHQTIGFIGPENDRYFTFRAALAARSLPAAPSHHCKLDNLSHADDTAYAETISNWLGRKSSKVTAVICYSDAVAFAAIKAMRRHNLTPGKDLSIIGHNESWQELDPPCKDQPLTTIRKSALQIGQRVADRLFNQIIDNDHQTIHEHVPGQLLIGASTGPKGD